MMPSVALNPFSLPMLLVSLVCLIVLWLSYSLDWRRSQERTLMGVYRIVTALNAVWMAVYFLGINGWLETMLATRTMLVLLASVPISIFGYVFWREGRRPAQSMVAMLGFCGLTMFAVAADRGAIIAQAENARLPHPALSVPLLMVLVILLIGLAYTTLEVVRRGSSQTNQARGMVIAAIVLAFTGLLDALASFADVALPPLSWIGSLVVTVIFSNAIARKYHDTFRSLERAEQVRKDLESVRESLEFKVSHDELTGLFARAHAMQVLDEILEHNGACVVFIDLDDFKSWNDTFGHATGDRVLRETAQVIRKSIRIGDIAARYAGDEFFIALPNSRIDAGRRVAETIRNRLADAMPGSEAKRITASFGVALGDQHETAAMVLDRADRAVYQAKSSGKDRVSSREEIKKTGIRTNQPRA
jgi:diguanylate cyclase (GGDEF)-like protein